MPTARSAAIAATVAVLFAAASAVAQSSGSAGATSSGSSQKNPSSTSGSYGSGTNSSSSGVTYPSSSGSSRSSGSYNSGAAADVDSTKEINSTSSTTAGAMTGRETSSNRLSWMDRRFVNKAADDGKAEVQIAQLAAQRATNPEVKSFAQKMVDDHTQVNNELTSLAGQKNVKLDNDDDKDRAYKRLNKKSGADFDQEFVEHMIDEHEKDIKLFEKAAKDAKDSDLRAFASKHLDHLREHLQIAQGLRQSVMPTGRTDSSSGRSTSGGTSSSGSFGSGSSGTSSSGSSDTSTGSGSSTSKKGSR